MEAMWNARRIECAAIAWYPLLAKATDAVLDYSIRPPSPLGHSNGILLGRFVDTTMKNWYLISAFARAAKPAEIWRSATFLSFGT
jgi:hypothetical protein